MSPKPVGLAFLGPYWMSMDWMSPVVRHLNPPAVAHAAARQESIPPSLLSEAPVRHARPAQALHHTSLSDSRWYRICRVLQSAGDQFGLYCSLGVADGKVLELLVEKDFACLDGTDADNEDAFPNPNHGVVCLAEWVIQGAVCVALKDCCEGARGEHTYLRIASQPSCDR